MSVTGEKVRRFASLPGLEKKLFLEALFLQISVGLVLKVLPFRRVPSLFSNPEQPLVDHDPAFPILIRNALVRSDRYSPWKNRCLVQSLSGRCMLRRRKIASVLSLGMAKDSEGKIIAHAWLTAADSEIVEKKGDYIELFLF